VNDLNRKVRIGLIVATSVAVALLAWFWSVERLMPYRPFLGLIETRHPRAVVGDIELYYTLKTVFSTLNATLLISLLILYVEIYIKRKVEFTLWLSIFSAVLLLDALTSNPFVQWVFGFRAGGLGPFAVLPEIFKFVALGILLYLTIRY